jgi:hypothetical protein
VKRNATSFPERKYRSGHLNSNRSHRRCAAILFSTLLFSLASHATATHFDLGLEAYRTGQFSNAAAAFRHAAIERPASGTLQNLGNAEWKRGRSGEAVLAWEQALWLNPFDVQARNNLKFARNEAQLESPELRWYEVASSWLPMNSWAWLTGLSLWIAVGALVLPGVLRRRKSAWQQVIAALGLGAFLLCIPAHLGTLTRARMGFVLQPDTGLRLTPTSGSEFVTRLAAGEPVRTVRTRGGYVFVRTSRAHGWLRQGEVGLIGGKQPADT